MVDDKITVNPAVDRSELRGRVLGNLNQMRLSIDNAQNPYEIFKDLGITPDHLNAPDQEAPLLSKMTAVRNAVALRWHPDKTPNKEDLARWIKIQEAFEILQDKQKRTAYNNKNERPSQPPAFEIFCPQDNYSSLDSMNPTYRIRPEFGINDIIQEFKDFYQQKTGEPFSPETAAAQGYAYSLSTDTNGNALLKITCPDANTRNECIQRFLDKNMIISPWEALKESARNEKTEDNLAPTVKSPFELPRLEKVAAI